MIELALSLLTLYLFLMLGMVVTGTVGVLIFFACGIVVSIKRKKKHVYLTDAELRLTEKPWSV